jgi:hypothetical protein
MIASDEAGLALIIEQKSINPDFYHTGGESLSNPTDLNEIVITRLRSTVHQSVFALGKAIDFASLSALPVERVRGGLFLHE